MKKVLILPFRIPKNLQQVDYLSKRILEELIDFVSHSKSLRAPSRSISLNLNDHPIPSKELQTEFGIDYVVEGNIKSVGGQYTSTARLVDAGHEEMLHVSKSPIDLDNWIAPLQHLLTALFASTGDQPLTACYSLSYIKLSEGNHSIQILR